MTTFHIAPYWWVSDDVEDMYPSRSRFAIPPRDSRTAVTPMRWVTGGEEIEVQGITIARGMVYFGAAGPEEEPSLVNPLLPIAMYREDSPEPVDFSPTYDRLSPTGRLRYLEWLADGARAPIDIGYVFLYFYGLERRLLLDEAVTPAELKALLAEVDRLLGNFGESNESFRFYSRELRDYVQLRHFPDEVSDSVPALIELPCYELPLLFRFVVGRFASDMSEIPVEWALRWALTDRLIRRRTPAKRCPEVFAQAFVDLYESRYAGQMVSDLIMQTRGPLKISYSGASPALRLKSFRFEMSEIADITDADAARRHLQSMVDAATSWIEPYSRLLGREPAEAGTLKANITLPDFLWPADLLEKIRELRKAVAEPMKGLTCVDLFVHLGYSDVPSPQMIAQLADGLRYLGVGMEPNMIVGARRVGPSDMVVLFPFQGDVECGIRDASFQRATVTVSLASCLALVDGTPPVVPGIEAIDEKIATWAHLSPDHRMRLRAQYRLGLHQPAALSALKTQLVALAEKERLGVVADLVHLAKVVGVLSCAKVRFLEQICRLLELDTQLIYCDLFSNSAGTTVVQKANLNQERIGELRRETDLVSALLGQVFDEATSEPNPIVATTGEAATQPALQRIETPSPPLLPGLSAPVNQFLSLLLSRSEWSRAELEAAAVEFQLMLDGTIETINEAALNETGALLIEGYDPLYIDREILERPTT